LEGGHLVVKLAQNSEHPPGPSLEFTSLLAPAEQNTVISSKEIATTKKKKVKKKSTDHGKQRVPEILKLRKSLFLSLIWHVGTLEDSKSPLISRKLGK
ncbi:unnamed protein product, partial [Ilex paraguariensis]